MNQLIKRFQKEYRAITFQFKDIKFHEDWIIMKNGSQLLQGHHDNMTINMLWIHQEFLECLADNIFESYEPFTKLGVHNHF